MTRMQMPTRKWPLPHFISPTVKNRLQSFNVLNYSVGL